MTDPQTEKNQLFLFFTDHGWSKNNNNNIPYLLNLHTTICCSCAAFVFYKLKAGNYFQKCSFVMTLNNNPFNKLGCITEWSSSSY